MLLLICFLAARLYRDVVVAFFRCFTLCFLCLALLLLLFHGMILSCIYPTQNSFFDHTSDIISYLPLLCRFVFISSLVVTCLATPCLLSSHLNGASCSLSSTIPSYLILSYLILFNLILILASLSGFGDHSIGVVAWPSSRLGLYSCKYPEGEGEGQGEWGGRGEGEAAGGGRGGTKLMDT